MPLTDVTILVTAFLRPGYLAETLRKIADNLPEVNTLVVDDSDIPTLPDHFKLESNRLVLCLPFDSGLSAKRNHGVQHCQTKYLLMGCDDFDFSTAEAREGILKLMDVLDNEESVDVAGGRVDNNPYEGYLEYVPGQYIREHRLLNPMSRSLHPVDLTVNYFLARTDRIVPWDERMKIGGEHGDFFLEMKQQERVTVFVPGVNIDTFSLDPTPENIDPRYPAFRGRARELGHKIFKEKRNIKEYRDWDGNVS